MKITVYNRDTIESEVFKKNGDYVLISISCPNDRASLPFDKYRKAVLYLEFSDVDQDIQNMNLKLFSKTDAQLILEFFNTYKNKYSNLIVHCDAGISRSPAVAAALAKIQDNYDNEYFEQYLPNRRVYSILLAEYFNGGNKNVKNGN